MKLDIINSHEEETGATATASLIVVPLKIFIAELISLRQRKTLGKMYTHIVRM